MCEPGHAGPDVFASASCVIAKEKVNNSTLQISKVEDGDRADVASKLHLRRTKSF